MLGTSLAFLDQKQNKTRRNLTQSKDNADRDQCISSACSSAKLDKQNRKKNAVMQTKWKWINKVKYSNTNNFYNTHSSTLKVFKNTHQNNNNSD